MIKKLVKAGVGVIVLPVAAAVDVITFPKIAEGDRNSSLLKISKSIVKNIEDAVSSEKPV